MSRNLEGDHKVIKFIENCIKSSDGWRFKKSGDNTISAIRSLLTSTLTPAAVTPAGAVLPSSIANILIGKTRFMAALDHGIIIPFPTHLMFLEAAHQNVLDSSASTASSSNDDNSEPTDSSVVTAALQSPIFFNKNYQKHHNKSNNNLNN